MAALSTRNWFSGVYMVAFRSLHMVCAIVWRVLLQATPPASIISFFWVCARARSVTSMSWENAICWAE